MSIPSGTSTEQHEVANLKRLALELTRLTFERFGRAAEEEQEVLATISDVLIETYAAESAVIRAEQTGNPLWSKLARIYLDGALDRAQMRAGTILPRIIDDIEPMLDRVRSLTAHELRDVIAIQREISDTVLAASGYPATANVNVTA